MTHSDIDRIISLFKKRKVVSYELISKEFGQRTNCIVRTALTGSGIKNSIIEIRTGQLAQKNSEPLPIFSHGHSVRSYIMHRNFLYDDQFQLSQHGENLLYEMRKEERNYRLSRNTFFVTCTGLAVGVIGLVIGWLSLKRP